MLKLRKHDGEESVNECQDLRLLHCHGQVIEANDPSELLAIVRVVNHLLQLREDLFIKYLI